MAWMIDIAIFPFPVAESETSPASHKRATISRQIVKGAPDCRSEAETVCTLSSLSRTAKRNYRVKP
jgi:hypothetical protein